MCYSADIKQPTQKQGKNMPTLVMKFNKDDHQIDIDTYISVLGALSIIAKEVNYEKNNSSDVQLSVVAQNEGSFESVIEFACLAAPIIAQFAPSMLEVISIMIELYKLKRVSDQIDQSKTQILKDDKVQICNNVGGILLVVNQTTNNIFNSNQSVQDALASSFNKIGKDETVNGFEMSSEDDKVEFDRSEFSAMSKKITIEPQDSEEQTKAVTLVVVKPVLEKSSNKWAFYLNGSPINADIKDDEFLEGVEKGHHSFKAGDRLMVELLVKNEYSEQYKIFIPKSYTVLKVKHHITADEAVQLNML